MAPHKTGVHVLVAEYNIYVMADIYWLGNYMLLRCSTESFKPIITERPRVTIHRVRHWWDRARSTSTLISRHYESQIVPSNGMDVVS